MKTKEDKPTIKIPLTEWVWYNKKGKFIRAYVRNFLVKKEEGRNK